MFIKEISSISLPLSLSRHIRGNRELQTWLLLLLVIAIAGLGSLSLSQHLLPAQPAHKHSAATAASPGGGECTATLDSIKYLSEKAPGALTMSAPAVWLKAGRSQEDFANAQACAAAFVEAYLSYDVAQEQTFEASVPMLSTGARQRFYGRAPHSSPDPRMDERWRASAQRYQLHQSAEPDIPGLIATQQMQGRLLVWMSVPYQLTIKTNENSAVLHDYYTVLLVDVPVPQNPAGTGWQVSDWRSGSAPFAPPDPL